MIFRLLALALLLAMPPAAAQLRCHYTLACDGEILSPLEWARGSHGWHLWFFWRPAGGGEVRSRYLMCPHAAGGCMGMASVLGELAQTCRAAADPMACAQAQWVQRVAWTCDTAGIGQDASRAALCQESQALRIADAKARGVAWPARPWVVSRSGMAVDATTRPVYQFMAGVRGAAAVPRVRATIGAPCDCSVRSGDYCAHDQAKATVTLCRPQ